MSISSSVSQSTYASAVKHLKRLGTCAFFVLAAAVPSAQAFQSPVEVPAVTSALAARSPLLAVTRAGTRIVAVGLRGDVVFSDDNGANWTQARVPVSTDLVAVCFPTAMRGWAVGHGGVVIHTNDGGATWVKQMDGAKFSALAVGYYQKMAADSGSAEIKAIYEQVKAQATDGSTRALLDVYFANESSGFVVGTFNRIFHTEDGGKTWIPWMDRINNDRQLHLYSLRGNGGHLVLTGEQGMVWELNPATRVFESRQTPYNGTLFGSIRSGNDLFVYGMRGSLFQSPDDGISWTKVDVPTAAGITGAATVNGRLLLVNQAGQVLLRNDDGRTFQLLSLSRPMSYFDVSVDLNGDVLLAGEQGVRVQRLPQPTGSKVSIGR